jgi:hypothetical protein
VCCQLAKKNSESSLCGGRHDLFKEGAQLNPADRDSVKQAISHWIVELGELVVTHDAAVVGKETESDIGLNPGYLREAVKAVGGASVDLRLIAKEEPILVLPHGETVASAKTVCVIMPVRV